MWSWIVFLVVDEGWEFVAMVVVEQRGEVCGDGGGATLVVKRVVGRERDHVV